MPKNSALRLKLVADTEQEHIMCKCIANKHFKQSCIVVNYRPLKSAPLFDPQKKRSSIMISPQRRWNQMISGACGWCVFCWISMPICEQCVRNAIKMPKNREWWHSFSLFPCYNTHIHCFHTSTPTYITSVAHHADIFNTHTHTHTQAVVHLLSKKFSLSWPCSDLAAKIWGWD